MEWLILAAAGKGVRMEAERNKVFEPLCGRCALARCLDRLLPFFDGATIVLNPRDEEAWNSLLAENSWSKPIQTARGGETRQQSIAAGLNGLPPDVALVAVHDAARPLVSSKVIARCLQSAREHGSGVPAIPAIDTMVAVTEAGEYDRDIPRKHLRAIQTPQIFRKDWLVEAHRKAGAERYEGTDDASILRWYGKPVRLVEGEARNFKLTTPMDFQMMTALLGGNGRARHEAATRVPRTGQGYDVHKLVPDRPLILCGEVIPYEKGLLGHSDADVALHALIDALLGAACLGDIGRLFPDKDPAYKDIDSMLLLENVRARLEAARWQIVHVDVTIVAQRPKLAGWIPAMRQNIAGALRIAEACASIKAKTTEGLGFEGRGEGMSALATATLLPMDA